MGTIADTPYGDKMQVPDTGSSGGGGSSAPIDRAYYSNTGPGLNSGDKILWEPLAGAQHGRNLLDFAVPTQPTITIPGIYAITVSCAPAQEAGMSFQVNLEVDVNGDDVFVIASTPIDSNLEQCAASLTWYCEVGFVVQATVQTDAIGTPMIIPSKLIIQLVAETVV